MSAVYIFVIDTNSYAGNFEREMCAHLTGYVGECGTGEETAEATRRLIPEVAGQLEELLEEVRHGDDDWSSAVSIYPTPRYCNNGHGGQAVWNDLGPEDREIYKWPAYNSVAIFFHLPPNADLVEIMKARAQTFRHNGVAVEGFRCILRRTTEHEGWYE